MWNPKTLNPKVYWTEILESSIMATALIQASKTMRETLKSKLGVVTLLKTGIKYP